MKHNHVCSESKINCTLALLLFCALALANTGCVPAAYFKTPNDVRKMDGDVFMKDGSVKHGKITILFEDDVAIRNRVFTFLSAGDSVETTVNIDLISAYVVSGNTYMPKNIDLYLRGVTHLLFVKRLNDAKSKMQLFELPQSSKSNERGKEMSFFYFSLPGFSAFEVVDLNSSKLIPNFDANMSELVSDCPELADKISQKLPGYFYSYMSFEAKKVAVIQKIAKEYNDCNTKGQ
jgi:hypothetical protein